MSGEGSMQQTILDFWFGAPDSSAYGKTRAEWFRKDAAFDTEIRNRFGGAVEQALSGGFADWDTARGNLARVLLLDQFTRNSFRDSPRAFAGDPLALRIAEKAVDDGHDRALTPVERWFLYMPFVHAESMLAQQRSFVLFSRLRDETGLHEPLEWAQRH